jgi:hypothetical protein
MHFVGYFCFNNNKKVDCNNLQMMCHILCYNSFINPFNLRIQTRKGLIWYQKTNGITIFNKYVNVDHAIIAKKTFNLKSIIHWKNKLESINKENIICLTNKFQIFLLQKIFLEMICNIIFLQKVNLWLSKSLPNVVCGKYLVKMFSLAFMFSSAFSFKKAIFKRCCLTWWRKQNKSMFHQN